MYYVYKVFIIFLVFWNNIFDKKKIIKKCNVLCKYNIFLVFDYENEKKRRREKNNRGKLVYFYLLCYKIKKM